jgi:hypothetical protein
VATDDRQADARRGLSGMRRSIVLVSRPRRGRRADGEQQISVAEREQELQAARTRSARELDAPGQLADQPRPPQARGARQRI